ncbi:MAG: aldehyde dehydrogenase, partial [Chloroflexota bacterium]
MTTGQQIADVPMYVDGRPMDSRSGTWLEVRSPATGELVGRVPAATAEDVDVAVAAARRAFEAGRWSGLPPAERAAV